MEVQETLEIRGIYRVDLSYLNISQAYVLRIDVLCLDHEYSDTRQINLKRFRFPRRGPLPCYYRPHTFIVSDVLWCRFYALPLCHLGIDECFPTFWIPLIVLYRSAMLNQRWTCFGKLPEAVKVDNTYARHHSNIGVPLRFTLTFFDLCPNS